MNGVDTQLILKPLQFNIAQTTDTSNTMEVVDTDEDTEKATSENNNRNLD